MSTITWLHLSDLHFRAGDRHTWDRDIVLRKLLDDVRERIKSDGLLYPLQPGEARLCDAH
jgi:hypothetical protein